MKSSLSWTSHKMQLGWLILFAIPIGRQNPVPAPHHAGRQALNSKSQQVIRSYSWLSLCTTTSQAYALAFRLFIRNREKLAPRTTESTSCPSTHWTQAHWLSTPSGNMILGRWQPPRTWSTRLLLPTGRDGQLSTQGLWASQWESEPPSSTWGCIVNSWAADLSPLKGWAFPFSKNI